MRRFTFLCLFAISLSLLTGCNGVELPKSLQFAQDDEKPLNLVTPKGYAKPVPIGSVDMSWEKKALLAMIAPSIAEQIEKNHDALKAPSNPKPAVAAKAPAKPAMVASSKVSKSARRAPRRVAVAKKKAGKALAVARKSRAFVAAKF